MTDLEFDILDELYFVTSFEDLKSNISISEEELKSVLEVLVQKGWVKYFKNESEELVYLESEFSKNYSVYQYLATKAGLLAHNGRG